MCRRNDQPMDFCGTFPGPEQLTFNEELSPSLSCANTEVNARYQYQSDRGTYEVSDYWTVPLGNAADCDDFVLAKILELRDRGIAVSAMVILIGTLGNR
ncbi:transglutaminase-like cysteine peptidase [Devosia psychrophila]|uniref:Transglutaminase-like cysteine proteinase BTLCP n=2 Tax=Devosia psychrophila TaxID=728005 RepID=A0A1I1LV20_9HYPH|nr:transglutaminase-like cysteine peptidase [Devosia psychrophila]SFC73310.1 transglutaminase-like cysteine proteinase BTLCP [Devosia psychrophila]